MHTLALLGYCVKRGEINAAVSQAFNAGLLWRDGQNEKLVQARASVRRGAQDSAKVRTDYSAE
jgi:hypothetical protein